LVSRTFRIRQTSVGEAVEELVEAEESDTDLIIDESSLEPEETEVIVENEIIHQSVVEDVDIENGFDINCHNIEIGESTNDSIEIFVTDDEVCPPDISPPLNIIEDTNGNHEYDVSEHDLNETVTFIVEDDGPPDIQLAYFPHVEDGNCPFVNETLNTIVDTDGGIIPVLKPEVQSVHRPKKAKTVTFSNPISPDILEFNPTVKIQRLRRVKPSQKLLRLKVEDEGGDTIENLPELVSSVSPPPSPRKSPKKESPIYENRKPGRPRTRPDHPNLRKKELENGITRFKQKSAEWKANELFKCGVCGKVLSCRGSFERHSRMHTDANPFKCSYCPKTFRESCKKNVHERVHSGSKPYPCHQCSKSFRTATQRNVHQRSHTKEKPYTCEVCGKVFSQPYSVKIHVEKFHK